MSIRIELIQVAKEVKTRICDYCDEKIHPIHSGIDPYSTEGFSQIGEYDLHNSCILKALKLTDPETSSLQDAL